MMAALESEVPGSISSAHGLFITEDELPSVLKRMRKYGEPQPDGCILWTAAMSPDGYGVLRVGRKLVRTNRVALALKLGGLTSGLFALHTCDVRACINPEHLFAGTQKANLQDASAKGRLKIICRHSLSEYDRAVIRARKGNGETYAAIAKDMGLSAGHAAFASQMDRRMTKHRSES